MPADPRAPDADGELVAAVDCGSNSTRLLVAAVDGPRWSVVERRTRITRLGAGVDRSGHLSPAAIDRVTAVLDEYVAAWRGHGVRRVAISATSAVRDAVDRDVLLDAVRRRSGVAPVVLTGPQEAALTYEGATAGSADTAVVCDIGGGSTELVAGAGGVPASAVSLQLGSVRLRERYLRDDPPTPGQYAAMRMHIDAVLSGQHDVFSRRAGGALVAVAGTALTVGALAHDAAVDAVDGVSVDRATLAQVIEDLAWLSADERRALPAIASGREDVIVAGAMLLHRVMARFGHAAVRVRVADLLDAMARRVAAGRWPPEPGRGVPDLPTPPSLEESGDRG